MEFADYRAFVKSKLNGNLDLSSEDARLGFALKLQEECGEVCGIIAKHLTQGHELDTDKLKLELGDVLFYIAAIDLAIEQSIQGWVSELEFFSCEYLEDQDIGMVESLAVCARLIAAESSILAINITRLDNGIWTISNLQNSISKPFDEVVTLAAVMRAPIEAIAQLNQQKLNDRYPNGFERDRSLNREDAIIRTREHE